jgi:bifunctional NMN adenylyltransferase/nudix hydrolase
MTLIHCDGFEDDMLDLSNIRPSNPPLAKQKPYKLAVVIGRFQIFHNGHKGLIDHALSIADHVLAVIGSFDAVRTPHNPFTAVERHEMINSVYPTAAIIYHYQEDHPDNDRWKARLSRAIDNACNVYGIPEDMVALVGYKKDHTSFYLELFPEYPFVPHEAVYPINSTDLREIYFGKQFLKFNLLKDSVPAQIYEWLLDRMVVKFDRAR